MTTLLRLLRLIIPFRRGIALTIVLNVATIGANVGLIAMAAYLIARAALVSSVADLALATASVRLFALSRAALRYAERTTSHTITFRILARLRTWFYTAIEPLAPARLQHYHSGDLFARIGADIETLQEFYVRAVAPPIAAALVMALASVLLGFFSLAAGVALLVFLLLTGGVLPLITRWLSRQPATTLVAARAALASALADGIDGDADLLAFGQAERHLQRIATLTDTLHHAQQRMALIRGLGLALGALLTGMASLTILGLAIPLVRSGQLPGDLLALLPLTAIASFEAVQPLALAIQHLEQGQAAAERLFELIDATPAVQAPSDPAPLPARYDLEVHDLRFQYTSDRPAVFDGLTFSVPSGGQLAIVGPSGAGKTTLTQLLVRFRDYQAGSIRIGGQALEQLDPEAVRTLFSVVDQQPYLFNSTIRDNLLIAQADATDAELLAICREARLDELIAALPQGLDTLIGEDGMRLSGGERQRLALARAMLKDAPMLILDEPLAGLDPITAQQIQHTLARFATGRTTLLLIHDADEGQVLRLDLPSG